MNSVIAVAVGGSLGSVARYFVNQYATMLFGNGFPYGILFVNVVGSAAIGVAYTFISQAESPSPYRELFIVGVLGGFTTFSTFSLDTINLLESGAIGRALLNVVLNLMVCLSACWAALYMTRYWIMR